MIDADDVISIAHDAWCDAGFGDLRLLPHSLAVVNLINQLECEVIQNGVHGWLMNVGPDGPATVEALEEVGAHQCAAIMREILSLFPGGTPAAEDQARVQQMEKASDADYSRWHELGDRLLGGRVLQWADDMPVLLQRYAAAHEADFTRRQ